MRHGSQAQDGVGQYYESYFEEDVIAAPVFAEGVVFIAGRGGTMVGTRGLSADRWQVEIPGSFDAGPIVSDGYLWVGNTDGVLYSLAV